MGMYTEFCFNVELVEEVPDEVVDILKYLNNPGDVKLSVYSDQKFFQCDRWRWLFVMDSAYFAHSTTSSVFKEYERWFINVHSNIKNYSNEIKEFLKWITPYIYDRGANGEDDFLGFYRYENDREPTLIYLNELREQLINRESV